MKHLQLSDYQLEKVLYKILLLLTLLLITSVLFLQTVIVVCYSLVFFSSSYPVVQVHSLSSQKQL